VIEGLEFRSARPPYTFSAANGTTQNYVNNAASIYVEKGEHITIRNCILDDSGNGLFIGSLATQPSRDFLIEGNSTSTGTEMSEVRLSTITTPPRSVSYSSTIALALYAPALRETTSRTAPPD
jgi:hypothetical protein